MVQIDGDVVFFDGTLFENLDEGVLCRYVQVSRIWASLIIILFSSRVYHMYCIYMVLINFKIYLYDQAAGAAGNYIDYLYCCPTT